MEQAENGEWQSPGLASCLKESSAGNSPPETINIPERTSNHQPERRAKESFCNNSFVQSFKKTHNLLSNILLVVMLLATVNETLGPQEIKMNDTSLLHQIPIHNRAILHCTRWVIQSYITHNFYIVAYSSKHWPWNYQGHFFCKHTDCNKQYVGKTTNNLLLVSEAMITKKLDQPVTKQVQLSKPYPADMKIVPMEKVHNPNTDKRDNRNSKTTTTKKSSIVRPSPLWRPHFVGP